MIGAKRVCGLPLSRANFSLASSVRQSQAGQAAKETKSREGVRKFLRPEGGVRPPYWRYKTPKSPLHMLAEEFKSEGDVDRAGLRLDDYWTTGDFILKHLPTPAERIAYVNPFERNWTRYEKRWHRAWLQPLMLPRMAWSIPSIPHYFDTLNFCKYVTKSRLLAGDEARAFLDRFYPPLTSPIQPYVERVKENLFCRLQSSEKDSDDVVADFLRSLVEDALVSAVPFNRELTRLRVSRTPRCESFWIRAGFPKLYEHKELYSDEITRGEEKRFTGDDHRMFGELTFTLRDNLVMNIRRENPLRNAFDWSDTAMLETPIFPEGFDVAEEVIYNPEIFRLDVDSQPLYQCPGYDDDVGETHKFGHLAVKSLTSITERMGEWRPESEQEELQYRRDMVHSAAVASLFGWLTAQAHCIGHTQFNDIEAPLTSQLILSDGSEFYFAIGQLNTIAINIDVRGFDNPRTNLCCVDGPYKLYKVTEDADSVVLNEAVIRRMLQMVVA